MSAGCCIFGEVLRLAAGVAYVRVAEAGPYASPVGVQWVVFPSSDEADAGFLALEAGSPVFAAGGFHLDVDGASAIVRIFATQITPGVRRPDGTALFGEIAEAELPAGWLSPGAVQ
jgi:hypothetical protein